MSSNPDAIPLRRTRSRRSIFREDFDSQHSTHYPDTLNQPATTTTPPSPTPRDLRQSAAAHEFVFGGPGQPNPRRLGLWHFLISHVSILAALVVGIICVVVSIVYTSNLGKRVLECPDWVRECPAADEWTVTHLGTIQGVMTLVYTIGMFALGYVALAFAETAVWAVLQKQSFTLKGLDAFVSATRGKIVAVPAAVLAVLIGGNIGPNLTYYGSRLTIAAGILPYSPENLSDWLHRAYEIKPGNLMSRVITPQWIDANLSEQDIADLVAYLDSMKLSVTLPPEN